MAERKKATTPLVLFRESDSKVIYYLANITYEVNEETSVIENVKLDSEPVIFSAISVEELENVFINIAMFISKVEDIPVFDFDTLEYKGLTKHAVKS